MPINLMQIHQEIMEILKDKEATFAHPLNSEELGKILNVTPSYIRERVQMLLTLNLVGVRHGRGGGYYIIRKRGSRSRFLKEWTEQASDA